LAFKHAISYTAPVHLQRMTSAEVSYIRDFEDGSTCLGPTHKMRVEKLIVTSRFPGITLVGKGEEGLTKEMIFGEMKRSFNNLFDFDDK
jgi:hypothetical protein